MTGMAPWEAEAHRTFAQSLLVALREAFPSVPGLVVRAHSSIRSSSSPSPPSIATYIHLLIRHIRSCLEAVGGPLDEVERRAFVEACRKAWREARLETRRLLAGDTPPELRLQPAVAFVRE